MTKLLTHRKIEQMTDLFFKEMGWKRLTFNKEKPQLDRKYHHPKKTFKVVAEIKPSSIGPEEIYKGIGQALLWLPKEKIKPVLIIPEFYLKMVKPLFSALDYRAGLLSYDKEGNLYWVINNIEITPNLTTHPLTKTPLCQCLVCGHRWKPHKTRRRNDLPRLCPSCQRREVREI